MSCLQRQKAEAAEAQSSKLAGQLEREQADNVKSSAKLKGTERQINDVLAEIRNVKEMHHLLLHTLGEASDSIQTGGAIHCSHIVKHFCLYAQNPRCSSSPLTPEPDHPCVFGAVDQQRERLTHSFDERFKLCQVLSPAQEVLWVWT